MAAEGCSCGCAGGCGTGGCACADETPAPATETPSPDPALKLTLAQTTTFAVSPVGLSAYDINGASNPTLTLTRGVTYTFNINATGHPFYIKTVQGPTAANAFTTGVTGNGTTSGALTFTVPQSAPDTLFYDCANHGAMTGLIQIVSIPEPVAGGLVGCGLLVFSCGRKRARRTANRGL